MYYFNNEYLKQYLEANAGTLKVLVDEDFFTIPSESDISNNEYGVCYDENGKPRVFHYQQVQAVMVGEIKFTLDQLQAAFNSDADKETGGEDAAATEEPTDKPPADIDPDAPADDKPEKGKDKQNSNYFYNRAVLRYDIRHGNVEV